MTQKLKKIFSLTTLFVVDISVILLSLYIANFFRNSFNPFFSSTHLDSSFKYFLFLPIYTILAIFIYQKIYLRRYDFWDEFKIIFKGIIFSALILFTFLSITQTSHEYSRFVFMLSFFLMLFLFPVSKILIKKTLFKYQIWQKNIYIVGDSQKTEELKREILNNFYTGFIEVINPSKSDIVLISTNDFTFEDFKKMVDEFTLNTKEVIVLPYLSHINFSNTNSYEYSDSFVSVISIENRLLSISNLMIKFFFEIVLSLLFLPIFLILLIIVSMAIKIDSKGTIFFRQKRLGKDKKVFYCIKFRTMHCHNGNLLKTYLQKNTKEVKYYQKYHKYKNDPRITRVGRFLRSSSLDEIPQFLNVLKGEMSLIGPRPYMLSERQKLSKKLSVILKVKPGISGLWQVSGRNSLTFERRMELDVWYIQNWSLWLDFIIFLKTFNVLFGEQIHKILTSKKTF